MQTNHEVVYNQIAFEKSIMRNLEKVATKPASFS